MCNIQQTYGAHRSMNDDFPAPFDPVYSVYGHKINDICFKFYFHRVSQNESHIIFYFCQQSDDIRMFGA